NIRYATQTQPSSGASEWEETETISEVEISFEESYRGLTRQIKVDYDEPCRNCGGTGITQNSEPCASCRGKGAQRKSKVVNITIAPGVKYGAKLRVPGVLGGKNLYLMVKVKSHSHFRRESDNVLLDLPITVSEAVLGTELEVPTLSGKVKMKIPPGTQNYTSFRLPGFGFPRMKNNEKGDQIVRISIVIPKNLNQKEKKLYEELSALRPENPRRYLLFE
ncbi:MAG TPA: DnaJ C-terminal domain-containing protein, partial [Atribacteraceae bacterium]|nr:DnaJ C-terminal domain-containing protein [Atribacteraceae bacterium]